MAGKLSAAFVRSAKEPGRFSDGQGLYLVVSDRGAKSWMQRLVIRGRRRDLGLGGASLVTLAEARAVALENRRIARTGGDPLAERRKARQMPTFAEAALSAHAELSFGNPKDGKVFLTSLSSYAFPRFGSLPVNEVTGPDIRAAVLAIRDEKPEVARKLILRCSAVFKWAIGEGHRFDNPATASALSLPALSRKAKTKAHRKALPYSEVAGCIETVHASGAWTATKLAIEFLILTASRSGEVRGALWSEVDLKGEVWAVPASRMKMSKEHKVPLSARALVVLREAEKLRDPSGLVFPSVRGKSLSDMTLSKLVKELGFNADVHGFRTSFRTWAQERTDFPFEVCEAALAHTVGNSASQAYAQSNVLEKRRKLMTAWASYLSGKQFEEAGISVRQGDAA